MLRSQAFVEPLVRDRGREDGPVRLGIEPRAHLAGERRLPEEQVPGLANLEVRAAADRGSGLDEVRRVEEAGAVLALVASCRRVPAVGTGPNDVAVGKEAAVVARVDLLGPSLLDEPVLLEPAGGALGEGVGLQGRAPAGR